MTGSLALELPSRAIVTAAVRMMIAVAAIEHHGIGFGATAEFEGFHRMA